MRKNTSCSEVGLAAWLADEPAGPTSISTGEFDRAGVEHEAGDLHAVHVGDPHGGDAVVGLDGGQAEAEDDGVGPVDLDRLGDVVHARGEEQVPALGEGRVDGGRAGAGLDDVELRPARCDVPAGVLLYQLVPVELVRSAGTKTRYSPVPST